MPWQPLSETLTQKPLVLAGPILRKVTAQSVTVWLALKMSSTVVLSVYGPGGMVKLSGQRASVEIGTHLHIVAVTADRLSPPSTGLTEGQIYTYDLTFTEAATGVSHSLAVATNGALIAYPGMELPSFCLPPADVNRLRLMHGSCRKPHGEGPDALSLLDGLIEETRDQPYARPHQLLLTGDQIYADEVAAGLLTMLTDASRTLLGWGDRDEVLPLPGMPEGSVVLPHMVPPFQRNYALGLSGFTSTDLNAHLMSLGEYLCMYLFAWSDVLWVEDTGTGTGVDLPAPEDIVRASSEMRQFAPQPPSGPRRWLTPKPWRTLSRDAGDQASVQKKIQVHNGRLATFHASLGQVRRALANVPCYMIFDDHEITDDWNMLFDSVLKVQGSALGRRVVQNGIVAYALCQHWGNAPEQFADDGSLPPGTRLLQLLDKQRGDQYAAQSQLIAGCIGLPTVDEIRAQRRLFHGPASLSYHHTVIGPSHHVVMTDSRTWRAFPSGRSSVLIPPEVLDTQLSGATLGEHEVLLVVLSTNAPPVRGIRSAEHLHWVASAFKHFPDVYESWGLPSGATDGLLKAISNRLPSVAGVKRGSAVLLSGDVHHSFAARVSFQGRTRFEDPPEQAQPVNAVYAQLISSAFRNADDETRELHRDGHDFSPGAKGLLIPKGRTERLYGWNVTSGARRRVGHEDWVALEFPIERSRSGTERCLFRWMPFVPAADHDWAYRVDYLGPPRSNLGPGAAPPLARGDTAAERRDAARQHQAVARGYRQYNRQGDGYQEVVGLNCISEISFVWPADDDKAVVHTMFWQKPGGPDPRRATSIRVSLDPADLKLSDPDL